jgi:hypothetical protein
MVDAARRNLASQHHRGGACTPLRATHYAGATEMKQRLWSAALAASILGVGAMAPASALGACGAPLGDLTGDGTTNVVDVQCVIIVVLEGITGGTEPPLCLAVDPAFADTNCDGGVTVTDAQLTIQSALNSPLSEQIDADQDFCPDTCQVDACGDGLCDFFEGCDTCAADCGACPPQPAWRIDTMLLADPHLFTSNGFGGCIDLNVGFLGESVNSFIQENLDDPANGKLLIVPDVVAPSEPVIALDYRSATCDLGTCVPSATSPDPFFTADATNKLSGTCLAPWPGTTTASYSPAPNTTTGPCFVTEQVDDTLSFGTFALPLLGLQMAAKYGDTAGNGNLSTGLLAGFLTYAAAQTVLLPEDAPLIGGQSLYDLAKNGSDPGGAPCSGDDSDTYLGQKGWWIYLNFTAEAVTYQP